MIPIIHKLQEKYIYLSNHLTGFLNDISDGVYENKKILGKKLLNYIVALSREGVLDETNFNANTAFQKYEQSQFVCKELLRDLNNTLKFSNEYPE